MLHTINDFVTGDKAMGRFREAIQGLEVGILVNNAGVVKPGALFLHEANVESLARMIRVNVLALTQVTAAVLPVMLHRGRGTIVNISSGSALALPSFPLYSVYAGTKRYAIKQILSKFSLETHIQK
jgi:17beta-estradiol 17-dehydrogenase / very-long-chain 3-oxoacyl-CoA reductase